MVNRRGKDTATVLAALTTFVCLAQELFPLLGFLPEPFLAASLPRERLQ